MRALVEAEVGGRAYFRVLISGMSESSRVGIQDVGLRLFEKDGTAI